ncbi:phage tail protein [uncultured Aquimarina sp.]|uniref:phage tail protein n=1 Tax=uncultured Aquimarina sp. TaxID=575652 RepID=UPI00260A595C|nr:phage tail protein [uncultured Aquimarina sp.]
MKSKLSFLLFFALFVTTITFAQSSATTAGIAVQGIARDGNNTARANATITLTFYIYHLVASSEVQISSESKTLQTDAFGVFSHVIDPTAENNPNFANYQAFLRISEGNTIISDEKLKHVPYAIAANNGVPTGSIMPFVGTKIPAGWALCDGQNLTSITGSEALITLLGTNNAPNLQGMFLRGTGISPVNNQSGPQLNQTQQDAFEEHSHASGSLVNSIAGEHDHNTSSDGGFNKVLLDNGNHTSNGTDGSDATGSEPNLLLSATIADDGAHNHNITGSTATIGGTETRPVNYGVNYIIKL